MSITLTRAQALAFVDTFGGDDETTMTLSVGDDAAHSGPGIYAHSSEYPDEGSIFLDPAATDHDLRPTVAIYATDVDPKNNDYTMVPFDAKDGLRPIWVRLADVSGADDEVNAGEDGRRDGEAFINTVGLPIA